MFQISSPLSRFSRRYRRVGVLLALLLACSVQFAFLGGMAHANGNPAVTYADNHWNWTAYNDRTRVPQGAPQQRFQCAEFVARALTDYGYMPGLNAYTSPQSAYQYYYPPAGPHDQFNLLAVTPGLGGDTLENYLRSTGRAVDIGRSLKRAAPGDVIIFSNYVNGALTPEHAAIFVSVGSSWATSYVDAHNNAEYHVSLQSEEYGFADYYFLHML